MRRVLPIVALCAWASPLNAGEPSRETTFDWLVEHLPKMGGKLSDEANTNVMYVHARAEAASCRVMIAEWTFTGADEQRKGVRQEMEVPLDRLDARVDVSKSKGGGHVEIRFRTADGAKSLEVRMESKQDNKFSIQKGQTAAWRLLDVDESHAKRVAKALEHAIKDCRGGDNKSAGDTNEPF